MALRLPGVFETTQWGGWAFKVPDPKRSGKAKLLTYVCDGKNHGWHAQFKLPAERAVAVLSELTWVEEHPWKTLGPSGWVVARPRTPEALQALAGLLAESRALLPEAPEADGAAAQAGAEPATHAAPSSKVAARMAAVMRQAKANGWTHRDDDAEAFDG